ncbi:MAG: discoidin domain-containing protein, partial [Clostridiales bacterium]|nr:discoidin domain-containing protein [Clostridiales bacterium]
TIHWRNAQKYNLAVAVSQVIDPSIPYTKPEFTPMREWKIAEGELAEKPKLSAINKDGVRLEGFSPDKYSYVVNLSYDTTEAPQYSFHAEDSVEVTQVDSGGMTGMTKFIVKNKDSEQYALYTVTSKLQGYFGAIPGAKEAEIVKVTASAEPEYDAGNRATSVLDGSYTTRWTATDDAWIMLELKNSVNVYAIGVAWFSGDSRTYIYDIEISEDGKEWKQVYSGTSSGSTTDLECFLLGDARAKYIRYQGHGHAAGNWNNVTEMRVYTK